MVMTTVYLRPRRAYNLFLSLINMSVFCLEAVPVRRRGGLSGMNQRWVGMEHSFLNRMFYSCIGSEEACKAVFYSNDDGYLISG